MLRDLEHTRDLIVGIVKVELKTRYFQKLLGQFWWLLDPVLNTMVFFFLTTVLFGSNQGPHPLLSIFSMTIFWRWFSKSINSAPELLLAYQGILRQTNFPVLVIPFATAAVELVFFFFGFVVLLAALVIGGVKLSWVALLLPWPFFVQLVLTVALSTMLASVGVFLRDLGQVVHLFTGIWFYLSPGIYPIEKIPEAYRQLYQINPFATLMPAYKAILLDGQMPNVEALAVWTGVSAALLGLSMAVLRRLRPRFYKVL